MASLTPQQPQILTTSDISTHDVKLLGAYFEVDRRLMNMANPSEIEHRAKMGLAHQLAEEIVRSNMFKMEMTEIPERMVFQYHAKLNIVSPMAMGKLRPVPTPGGWDIGKISKEEEPKVFLNSDSRFKKHRYERVERKADDGNIVLWALTLLLGLCGTIWAVLNS